MVARWSRPAARALVLDDLARAFLAADGRDEAAAAAFAEIAPALLPLIDMKAAVSLARLLAGRRDVPEPVLAALAARGLKPRGAAAPSGESVAPGDETEIEPPRAEAAPDLFLDAGRAARDAMIAQAAQFAALDSGPELRRRIDAVTLLALERAASRNDGDDAAAILSRTLALPLSRASLLLADQAGDGLAILLRAAALDEEQALRLFVGVGPAPTRRGAGLRAALDRFRALDRATAIRLLAEIAAQSWIARRDEGGTSREHRRAAAHSATFSPSFARDASKNAANSDISRPSQQVAAPIHPRYSRHEL
jgi:hypothetical protein